MSQEKSDPIRVIVETAFLEGQSDPTQDRYVFSYTITIRNNSNSAAQLLNRHWIITDANGKTREVKGEGVVGEQPYLQPGEGFKYSSGAIIETPVGSMHGRYQMVTDHGEKFFAPIKPFTLAIPGALH